ncbi:MAG: hypothetical protein BWY95_01941 [Bacteroidetes bacterium ADurb.BinA104]|nr:MAG: hypothetical protein BWY95_01941 [Bacteroidetes bacterium ADurb.BinA104]
MKSYRLTNLITGYESTVKVNGEAQLADKIQRFIKYNSITESDVRIDQIGWGYPKRYVFNGEKFASQTLVYRYQDLLYLKATGAITNLRVNPQYDLIEAFCYNGYEFRKLFYQADFEYYDTVKQRLIIEDYRGHSKNRLSDKAKTQLFIHMYKDKADIRFIHRDLYNPIKKRPTILTIEESNDRKDRLQNKTENL